MSTVRLTIDPSHSGIHFVVRHLVISKVRGAFTRWQGTIDFDEKAPAASKVSVHIEAASVDTRDAQRDAHLRSADFLDVDRFPDLAFESTAIAKVSGAAFRITGQLTMHGVSLPVTLDTEYLGAGEDPRGNKRVGFQAKTSINRRDFGLQWNQTLETGGVLVGDRVEIALDVQAVMAQPATNPAATEARAL